MTGDEYIEKLVAEARAGIDELPDDEELRRTFAWRQLTAIASANIALREFGLTTERGAVLAQQWGDQMVAWGYAVTRRTLTGEAPR